MHSAVIVKLDRDTSSWGGFSHTRVAEPALLSELHLRGEQNKKNGTKIVNLRIFKSIIGEDQNLEMLNRGDREEAKDKIEN